jgi:hypothetical protein
MSQKVSSITTTSSFLHPLIIESRHDNCTADRRGNESKCQKQLLVAPGWTPGSAKRGFAIGIEGKFCIVVCAVGLRSSLTG